MDEIQENFNSSDNIQILDLGLLNNTVVNQNSNLAIGGIDRVDANSVDIHFFSLEEQTNILIDASLVDSNSPGFIFFHVFDEENDDGIFDRANIIDGRGILEDAFQNATLLGTGGSEDANIDDDQENVQLDLPSGDYFIFAVASFNSEVTPSELMNLNFDTFKVDYTLQITPTPLNSDSSVGNDSPDNTEEPNPELDPDLSDNTVYRFFNNDSGVHFYTSNEAERDAVSDLPNFSFEGPSYQSIDPLTGNPEPSPVYRFLNQETGVHLYTISEVERDTTQELDNFIFEGEAFFAYESEVEGSIPIYRFFNSITGAHFYTPSAAERDFVGENLTDFQSEGIAYYANPLEV